MPNKEKWKSRAIAKDKKIEQLKSACGLAVDALEYALDQEHENSGEAQELRHRIELINGAMQ